MPFWWVSQVLGKHVWLKQWPPLWVFQMRGSVHARFDADRYFGVEVLEDGADGTRQFRFQQGLCLRHCVSDEINRASPRTQSALLQAMQERRVTIAGKNYELPKPSLFWQRKTRLTRGNLPTPRSAAGSFLLSIEVGYPDIDTERAIILETTALTMVRHQQYLMQMG